MDWFYADGSDSKGPHDAAQMARLLAQGRVHGETPVWRDGLADWTPLRDSGLLDAFQDTAPAPAPGPAPTATPARVTRKFDLSDELPAAHAAAPISAAPASEATASEEDGSEALAGAARAGAQWLYWIAGLSVINLVLIAVDSPVSMALGLGITDLIYYFALGMAEEGGMSSLPLIALAVNLVLITLVAGLGWLAVQGNRTVYLIGTVLMVLDGLLFIYPMFSIIGLAVHGYAVYAMTMGLLCLWRLPAPDRRPA